MIRYFEPIELTEDERKILRGRAAHRDTYRFLGVKAVVGSDSPALLDIFRQTYRYFLIDGGEGEAGEGKTGEEDTGKRDAGAHTYCILSEESSPHGPLLLWEENRVYRLLPGAALPDSADIVIFANILSKISSFFCLHGAALSSGGGAIVLAGLSGAGKTTLALELTRRGMSFFSDEIAAISRGDHHVHPFPRAIGTRERTLELLDRLDFAAGRPHPTAGGKEKWMVDIEDIFEEPLAGPCPARLLVLLDTVSPREAAYGRHHDLTMALARPDERLLERLDTIEGVERGDIRKDGAYYLADCRVRRSGTVQRAFLDVCREFDDTILYRVKAVRRRPDPAGRPVLTEVPGMEAAMELLGNLQNLVENDGWMTRESSAVNSRILFELLELAGTMRCYRLLVGNLGRTADLIEELVSSRGERFG